MGVTVNLDGVRKKVSTQSFERGKYALGNQALADMNPFIPRKEGILRMTGHVTADGSKIMYETPYGKAQFYGRTKKAVFKKYSTPGTGPRWDLKAKGLYLPSWKRAFLRGSGIN